MDEPAEFEEIQEMDEHAMLAIGEALMLGIFLGYFCLVLAVPYAIPVATPSGRWLLTCGVFVGGLLAYGWSLQISAWQHPDFREERLPLGHALLDMLTISFAAGVAIRGLSLALARLAARPLHAIPRTPILRLVRDRAVGRVELLRNPSGALMGFA